MDSLNLMKYIEGVDIYIIDQILKNRFKIDDKILDAGCGKGRNLKWFYHAGYEIYGLDIDESNVAHCKEIYENQKNNFQISNIEQIPFNSNSFNHIICNAVLHFSKDLNQFSKMFNEIIRILKPKGTLFIRTASIFGIENLVEQVSNGVYKLPDGTNRFLLTNEILQIILDNQRILLIEDIKTTIVQNKMSMTTLVFEKK